MKVSLARFLGWSALLLPLAAVVTLADRVDPLRRAAAWSAWWIADAAGLHTTLVNSEIYTRTRVLDVAVTCLPLSVLAVSVALVLATPARPVSRACGLLVAVAAQWVANVARVAAGIAIAQSAPDAFDAFHAYVLPIVPVVAAFSAWLVWARRSDASR